MDIKRAPAGLAISGLALVLTLASAWAPVRAGAAVPGAGQPPSYVAPSYMVLATAGSTQDPNLRPPMPSGITISDGSSMPMPLAHFRGVVVVMNFWATWCGPCVKEMQFLDRLQGDLKGQPLVVLPVSEDRAGIPAAKGFFARQKLTFLHPFADPRSAAATALHVEGIPTSFIIDKQGRLVQRLEGPYEWDSPPIVARIRELMNEQP